MTEQEAKTKWCPFVRNVQFTLKDDTAATGPFNRLSIDDGSKLARINELPHVSQCIGSACMAWRWGPSVAEYGSDPIGDDANHLAFKPSGEGWEFGKITRRWVRSTPDGFCGLAGKP